MAGNGLLKRQLSLFDTAFVNSSVNHQDHQRLIKSNAALFLRLLLVKNFAFTPYQAQQIEICSYAHV